MCGRDGVVVILRWSPSVCRSLLKLELLRWSDGLTNLVTSTFWYIPKVYNTGWRRGYVLPSCIRSRLYLEAHKGMLGLWEHNAAKPYLHPDYRSQDVLPGSRIKPESTGPAVKFFSNPLGASISWRQSTLVRRIDTTVSHLSTEWLLSDWVISSAFVSVSDFCRPSYGQWTLRSAMASFAWVSRCILLTPGVGSGSHCPVWVQKAFSRRKFSQGISWARVILRMLSTAPWTLENPVFDLLLSGRARALWGTGSKVLLGFRWYWTTRGLSVDSASGRSCGRSRSRGRPLFASPILDLKVSFVYGQLVNFLSFWD